MIYLGIDHHKAFSQVAALSDAGETLFERRIPTITRSWTELKAELGGAEVRCVLEAGWNWGKLYDILEELELNPVLANPLKVRLIAESCIKTVKTDRRDAMALAQLLRMGWVPTVHVPSKEVRDQKNLLRQRAWLVRERTAIKNRVHSILDRNHLEAPEVSDIFGKQGRAWLRALKLREPDDKLLGAHLDLYDAIQGQVREAERWIDGALCDNEDIQILMSLPGIGKLLSALIALEIHGIARFPSPEKLCAYAGLTSSARNSGETIRHGGLIPACNRHLRGAFIEAAWVTSRVSPYFGAFFRRLKARRGSQKAIGATARRLCEIAFHCLRRRRQYIERPYKFRPGRPVGVLA
jgi:transposase